MTRTNGLKVGDFVKHRTNAKLVFQIVEKLDSANAGEPGMLHCIEVRDVVSYPENEVVRHELTDKDRDRLGLVL